MTQMQYVAIKNWEKFQHYAKRTPPWIKLHTSLLTDYEYNSLSTEYRLTIVLLWLYAAKVDNYIPLDNSYVANEIKLPNMVPLETLIEDGWVYIVDSTRQRRDRGEAETEGNGREYKRREYPDDFRQYFYGPFPRHESIADAAKAWEQTADIRPDNETMLAAVQAYARCVENREKRHIKLPATWLRASGWDDYTVGRTQQTIAHLPPEALIRREAALHSMDPEFPAYREYVRGGGSGTFEEWRSNV